MQIAAINGFLHHSVGRIVNIVDTTFTGPSVRWLRCVQPLVLIGGFQLAKVGHGYIFGLHISRLLVKEVVRHRAWVRTEIVLRFNDTLQMPVLNRVLP